MMKYGLFMMPKLVFDKVGKTAQFLLHILTASFPVSRHFRNWRNILTELAISENIELLAA